MLLASQAARATTLEQGDDNYTTLAGWEAAVAVIGVDTFSVQAGSGNETTYTTAAGYTDPLAIDFVGAFTEGGSWYLGIAGALFNSPYYNYTSGTGASMVSGTVSTYLQPEIVVTLPANVTAIGLDVMTYSSVIPVTLTANDGTTATVATASRPAQTFYGFTFSAPVSTFTISVPGAPNFAAVMLDNFTIGTADVPAPEPATMLLIGLGLVFMACLTKLPRLIP